MSVSLKSTQVITAVVKKTKARLFEHLRVGDVIELSMAITPRGRGPNGIYATYVTVKNLANKDTATYSLNQLSVLDNFTFEEQPNG